MAPSRGLVAWAALLGCLQVEAVLGVHVSLAASANPIRRAVNMLQALQKKVEEEGKKEEELYERFMCFCNHGGGDLKDSIAKAEEAVPRLESKVEEAVAAQKRMKADISKATEDRAAAQKSLKDGEVLRGKEQEAYRKGKTDLQSYILALQKAIKALSQGLSGSFLQTRQAATLRQLSIVAEMSESARDLLTSFLTQGSSEADSAGVQYVPQSGEIIGMLSQMLDDMQADLESLEAKEAEAKKDYEGMTTAKQKEVATLAQAIEDKLTRLGAIGVDIVNLRENLEDTSTNLAEDKEFLKSLERDCGSKKEEWEVRQKTRAEELLAIADTIKLLNDDDALDLFRKTLPKASSFLQLDVSPQEVRQKAYESLKETNGGHKPDYRLNLIALALTGRKVSFTKVIEMIDKLIDVLHKEQVADDEKKETCEKEIAENEAQLKALQVTIGDLTKRKDDLTQSIKALSEEMDALEKSIKELDKQVAEATEQRKQEHAEFKEELASHTAAMELLDMAVDRLNKFYNPELYEGGKPKAPSQLEEVQVYTAFGGAMASNTEEEETEETATSFIQASSVSGAAPLPETWGKYDKKHEEKNQVVEMIGFLKADLQKEVQEMQHEEETSQAEYEELLKNAAKKRESDTKALANKSAAKAASEQDLLHVRKQLKATKKEAKAVAQSLAELHADCDWLLENHEIREEARAGEVESLRRAKAVLSGADYSFVQLRQIQHHQQRR